MGRNIEAFLKEWEEQFLLHRCVVYIVHDGEKPRLERVIWDDREEVEVEDHSWLYNLNDGVRNLGFAQAFQGGADVIVSLDDDVLPVGDTIGDHLEILEQSYPVSWVNTTKEHYMRGFPYGIRQEAKCVLSHGVWNGVADFDASSQLVFGTPEQTPVVGPIPKGVLFPMCIMNVAFKREATPWMYQAPMGPKVEKELGIRINRFADIWGGIEAKKDIDANGYAAFSGHAKVYHARASDPFVNLQKEALGIQLNEHYGEGEYFKLFEKRRKEWQKYLKKYED